MRIFPDDCPDGEDSALVAELRRMLAEVVVERDTVQTDAHDELSALRAQLADRTREVEGLREALQPFVRHWESWMDGYAADVAMSVSARVTFGQLRAARAALGAKP